MSVNCLGSKTKLLDFIEKIIVSNNSAKKISFCDLFSGSGVVAYHFKEIGYDVVANDVEEYSVLFLNNLIKNTRDFKFKKLGGFYNAFKEINSSNPVKGFIYNNYSPAEKKYGRKYFTTENASKIDGINLNLKLWYKEGKINLQELDFLKICLIKAAEKISNTAAVYEAYLKDFKASSLKKIILLPINIEHKGRRGKVFNKEAGDLISKIKGDVLYLDPPYNSRQYSSNYHILNTIALNDSPSIKGKTGNREDNFKSAWCRKKDAAFELEKIIKKANFKQIYLSYNCEGIISEGEIEKIFKKYGKYRVYKIQYRRFKSNAKGIAKKSVTEYLHYCKKED